MRLALVAVELDNTKFKLTWTGPSFDTLGHEDEYNVGLNLINIITMLETLNQSKI